MPLLGRALSAADRSCNVGGTEWLSGSSGSYAGVLSER